MFKGSRRGKTGSARKNIGNNYLFKKNALHFQHDPKEENKYNTQEINRAFMNANKQGTLSLSNEKDVQKMIEGLAETQLKQNCFFKALEDTNTSLKKDLDNLLEQNTSLKQDLDKLSKQNKSLATKIETLEDQGEQSRRLLDNEKERTHKMTNEMNDLDRWRNRFLELEVKHNQAQENIYEIK